MAITTDLNQGSYTGQLENDVVSKVAGYEPSEDEQKTIRLVMKLFHKAKLYRKKYDEKWLERYKMFRGRQWPEARPSYRHSEVINLVFQLIQSQIPLLTDSRPKISFLPQNPEDIEFSEILNEITESDWEKGNWLYELMEVIYDGYIYGTGLSSMLYDPDLEYGLGAVQYKSADPFYCFPDPNARDVNKESGYFIYAEPKDISWVKMKYPEVADFIRSDVMDLMNGSKTEFDKVRFKSPTDTRTLIEGSSANELSEQDKVILVTCYLKSDEMTEEEVVGQDEQGNHTKEYVQKKKWPNGRRIVLASGVLCEDGELPYDDGKFPYSKWVNYPLPREFWGQSEIEQLEGPQRLFNKIVSFAMDVLTLMGNPIWVVDTSSGIDTDNLINRPGLVVEKEPNSEVRREEGVQLQPYVLQMVDRLKEWFDQVGGAQDISRGVNPTGVTAASAIAQLQEAAQTRIRQKTRLLDFYLQDLGQQYASRVMQYYTVPRIFRLTNKDGAQKFFKFSVEQGNDQEGNPIKVARVRPYSPVDGKQVAGEEREYVIRGEFDVRVTTGSTLPFAKAEKEQRLFNLFDRQIIDAQEVLDGLDYPNAEAVLQRIAQNQQAQAQAQAAQEGVA